MKGTTKLSTLSARFSAPSSSNPAHLPNEMHKGFVPLLVAEESTNASSSEELAIHGVIKQVLRIAGEIVPTSKSIEVKECQCNDFCRHRKETLELLVCQAEERLADRSAELRKLRAVVEDRRQKALSAALRCTESRWVVHTRAREAAKLCNAGKIIRPMEVLTGSNDKLRCVKIATNRPYCLLRLLGRGGFSSVWEVYDRDACKRFAAKLTMMPSSDHSDGRDAAKWLLGCLTREVMLLKKDRTPTLLGTHDCFNWKIEGSAKGVATIHDLCDCDLAVWMRRVPLKARPRPVIKRWLRDILEALDHLHTRRGVLHTDLKPENVLKGICDVEACTCRDSRCKVADFGLHKVMVELPTGKACKVDMSDEGNWNGTIIYQPPEHLQALLDQKKCHLLTAAFDVWSVGVIALELLQNCMPFRPKAFRRDVKDIAARVLATQRSFTVSADDPEEQQFLGRMLAPEPEQRLSAAELLKESFLRMQESNAKSPSPNSRESCRMQH